VGDQFLVEVAHRLKLCIRDGDTVARLGGDEFVVILEDLDEGEHSAVQAEGVGQKILERLGSPYELKVLWMTRSRASAITVAPRASGSRCFARKRCRAMN
jgi:diguanylate cyclase (GGDEF)-like protein